MLAVSARLLTGRRVKKYTTEFTEQTREGFNPALLPGGLAVQPPGY